MCRSKAEGGRRCSCNGGQKAARLRQRRCRAKQQLLAAQINGDSEAIAEAAQRYEEAGGDPSAILGEDARRAPEPLSDSGLRPLGRSLKGATLDQIEDAVFDVVPDNSSWYGLADLRAALGDVDQDDLTAALRRLAMTPSGDSRVYLTAESNRKVLTEVDRAAEVTIGGEPNHVIRIEPPRDAGAATRVKTQGVVAASDADLESLRIDSKTTPDLYDAVRAEQRRRKQEATASNATKPSSATKSKSATTKKSRQAASPVASPTPEVIEAAVREVYKDLAEGNQDWIRLARVRERLRTKLGNVNRSDVDAVLVKMTKQEGVHLVPDSNRKVLTHDDHEAAVRVGSEDKNLLAIEDLDVL